MLRPCLFSLGLDPEDLGVESTIVSMRSRALDEINEAKIEQITKQVPKSIRKSENFVGVKGTPVYEGFIVAR